MGAKVHLQNSDNWIQDRKAFRNPVDMFEENLDALVDEEGSIFPIQKDEVIRVEELYRCSDLSDDVLSLNASNQRMHYNVGEFLTLEYHPTTTDRDIPDSNPNLSDDVEIFCDGILGETHTIFPQEKSNVSDSCKYYLVGECFNGSKSIDASVAASFGNMVGYGTTVTDKQSLKNRLCFSSHNLLPSCDNQSNVIMPTINQFSDLGGSLFSDVFNFKKKPRLQRVRRRWQANHVPWKELSLECGVVPKLESSEIEEDNVHVAIKRSRKPIQRYVGELMEPKYWNRRKKSGASTKGPKNQHHSRKFEAKRLICPENTFNGECIQVPFGEPIISEPTKEKVHQPKDSKKGTGLLTLDIDTKGDSVSVELQENLSEDDCNEEKMNTIRRKHNKYWSVSEVLNLVEGVSVLGVGKWTEIKKLKFNSSPYRTAVDLKDKWRNLLRASCCSQTKKKREVEQRKKHTSQQIPKSVLRRVKELAAIQKYPRPTQAAQTLCVASPHPSTELGICLPLSTAVRV